MKDKTFNLKDGTKKNSQLFLIRNQVKGWVVHKDADKDFKVNGWKKNK